MHNKFLLIQGKESIYSFVFTPLDTPSGLYLPGTMIPFLQIFRNKYSILIYSTHFKLSFG